jgi:hypothetical protein
MLKHSPLIPAQAGIQGKELGPRWSLSLGGPKVRPEDGDELKRALIQAHRIIL